MVLHGTDSGLETVTLDEEWQSTINWFKSNGQVSAGGLIGWDGSYCQFYPVNSDGSAFPINDPMDTTFWHARWFNSEWDSVELVHRNPGDPISDAQYKTLAWRAVRSSRRYGYVLGPDTLPEHRTIPPGISDGKVDVGPVLNRGRLMAEIAARGGR